MEAELDTLVVGAGGEAAGVLVEDPLVADERFVAVHVRSRGVSVLSSCSHAGIVNTCRAAMAAFPHVPVDVVLGGYHLAGSSMEARIVPTIRDLLREVDPGILAPAHCTGWRAHSALSTAGFRGYAPSAVGARYQLQAQP